MAGSPQGEEVLALYYMADEYTKHTGVCGMSGYSGFAFGQEVVCLAEAFYRSGHEAVKPSVIANHLNSGAGWTGPDSDFGPGMVDLDKFRAIFPAFHLGGTQYSMVYGSWGIHMHCLLRLPDGTYYEPLSGTIGAPPRWFRNGKEQTFHIDPA